MFFKKITFENVFKNTLIIHVRNTLKTHRHVLQNLPPTGFVGKMFLIGVVLGQC